jgi:hypothetical protein
MPKPSNSSIKFGFWNIGGLCTRGMNKAEDSIFLKKFEPYDITFLVETHIGYNSKIHNIGNFHYHSICRNVSNNNRHFGGIAILIKSYIKPHVKILKKYIGRLSASKTGKDLLWIQKRSIHLCYL